MVDVGKTRASARRWTDVLAGYGVLAAPVSASVIRFVTHRHVSKTDIERAVATFSDIYTTRPKALFAA
jgi:threonine aldolase